MLSLKGTGMGPVACGMLATSLSAGVTKIDISGADIDTSSQEALKTAAPEGCEVVHGRA